MNISIFASLCVFLIYIFINITFKCSKKKKDNTFLILSFLLLLIILFIREPYSDLKVYLTYFHFFKKFSFSTFLHFDMEILYKFLSLFLCYFWENDRFFICIVSIITCIGPYYFIKKYSKIYLLSTVLFIAIGTFFMQFYLLRQAIAISILLFSIKYIEDRKLLKFLLIVIFASLFHKSALVFIPLYFISNERMKKINPYLFVFTFIFTFIFKSQITSIISKTAYSNYLDSTHGISGGGYGKLSLYLLLLLFNYFFTKENEKNNSSHLILNNMSFMYIIIQIIATRVKIAGRLANYFCMSYIILTANNVNNIKKAHDKMAISLLIIIITIIYLYFVNQISGYSITPLYLLIFN